MVVGGESADLRRMFRSCRQYTPARELSTRACLSVPKTRVPEPALKLSNFVGPR